VKPTLDIADLARWSVCAALVLAAHAAAAAILVTYADPLSAGNPEAAIVVDLSPIAAAPADAQPDMTPGPPVPQIDGIPEVKPDDTVVDVPPEKVVTQETVETKSETKPVDVAVAKTEPVDERAEIKPQPSAQDVPLVEAAPEADKPVVVAAPPVRAPPPPKPKPKKASRPLQLATAPTRAPEIAPRATAPNVGMPSPESRQAALSWTSSISAAIERAKRYPTEARARNEQGTAIVSFTLSRSGSLTSSRIARSSGYAALDQESLAAVQRASFPPPPSGYAGSFSFSQPMRFNIR
jgi:periplasmic protein TonB